MSASSQTHGQHWKFVVFISGSDPTAEQLIENLRSLIREHGSGAVCEVDIVDIQVAPHMAAEFQIFAVPTIVRMQPMPVSYTHLTLPTN